MNNVEYEYTYPFTWPLPLPSTIQNPFPFPFPSASFAHGKLVAVFIIGKLLKRAQISTLFLVGLRMERKESIFWSRGILKCTVCGGIRRVCVILAIVAAQKKVNKASNKQKFQIIPAGRNQTLISVLIFVFVFAFVFLFVFVHFVVSITS